MLTDGRGKILQLLDIEFFARLARVALDQINRDLCNAALPTGRFLTSGNESIESFAESGAWWHECSPYLATDNTEAFSQQS
jgi:hypothetical protein